MIISQSQNSTMGFKLDENDLRKYMAATLGLSPGTIVTRLSRIRIFYSWLCQENCPISPSCIEDFFWFLKNDQGIKNTAANVYLHSLRSFEAYLIDRKLCEEKFMSGRKPYKMEDPNKIPLSPEEVKLLKDACREKSTHKPTQTKKDMIILIIDTGMRWEDVQNLRCESVDIVGRQLRYIQLKTGIQRAVHLEDPSLSILQERITNKDREELVFVNSKGGKQHYPNFYEFLVAFAKSLGIVKHVTPHILRHSYCQNLYDLTGDINLVKDTIGHNSLRSTLRYVRNSPKKVRNAQQMHPHLSSDVNPQIKIDLLEKEIQDRRFQEDKRFDYRKVKRAINNFITELHYAVNDDSLNLS